MRRLLLLPLAALLGCPQTPWCDRLNPDQPDGLQTCVFADEVTGPRPFTTEDGYPVDFEVGLLDGQQGQPELADGTRLTGTPDGLDWRIRSGDPNAERAEDRFRSKRVRFDSLGPVASVEVAPDESGYAVGLSDGRFLVRSMDHAPRLEGRATDGVATRFGVEVPNAVTRFAFSSDGAVVVTSDRLQNVDVWAPDDGGHRWHAALDGAVRSLGVSPDKRLVAAGSDSGTLTVWDAATGAEVATWTHPRPVVHIGFTDDEAHVVAQLGGAYHAARSPTALETNQAVQSAENVDRALRSASGSYTEPNVVAVWRLP